MTRSRMETESSQWKRKLGATRQWSHYNEWYDDNSITNSGTHAYIVVKLYGILVYLHIK